MEPQSALTVKVATEAWEFEQIHHLNHQTFAEEIPQHAANPLGRLVDRFHHENTYVIALAGRELMGMLAIRERRPFSLEQKLPDLERYLPAGRSICEFRLLAVQRRYRAGQWLPALFDCVWRHCLRDGFDLALISAVTRQLKLYRHLGFEPFGPLVGTPPVLFQPMMLTLERFAPRAPKLFRRMARTGGASTNFLPGPVTVQPEVSRALRRPAVSHRSAKFLDEMKATRANLCALTRAARAEILLGSGTMANDAIAGQLSLDRSPGLVLCNGEFGERLVNHARRWGLSFEVIAKAWGEPFDVEEVERILVRAPARNWLWFVHCETSTGVLNDLDALGSLRHRLDVKLCVDAISSIGTMPLDLSRAYFASGVSGKGLGAFPGLAIVLYDHEVSPAPTALPSVLDLGLYARHRGVPFTHSSNLVHALHTALRRIAWHERYRALAETSAWLRARVRRLGFQLVGAAAEPSSAVVTIALPASVNSATVGAELEKEGYLLSANSQYLKDRNWIQICLMGEPSREQLSAVLTALLQLCADPSCTAATLRC
jgi:aspartate aminotransferase-like enzyme